VIGHYLAQRRHWHRGFQCLVLGDSRRSFIAAALRNSFDIAVACSDYLDCRKLIVKGLLRSHQLPLSIARQLEGSRLRGHRWP